jgi:SAM-dependent methyltransferase
VFTPARRSTPEFLDDPASDPDALSVSAHDIANCNRLLGGRAALVSALREVWRDLPRAATMLDVGCGVADLPAAARAAARAHGVGLTVVGLDRRHIFAQHARCHLDATVVGDAFAIPLRDASIDVVTASQFLHHFSLDAIASLAREFTRVARHCVVISDLRRSWVAAGGLWLASWPLRLHTMTRHDGVASVLKGFVASELRDTLTDAVGCDVAVATRAGFRLTARWKPPR